MNYKNYHPDWQDIIRPAVLKRDSYKCRHCGINHKSVVYLDSRNKYVECDDFIEDWAKANGKKPYKLFLHVAHIDQNKSNNDFKNLMTLCPRCHSSFDAEFKKFKRIIKEPQIQSSKRYLLKKGNLENRAKYLAIRKFIFSLTSYQLETNEIERLIKIVEK